MDELQRHLDCAQRAADRGNFQSADKILRHAPRYPQAWWIRFLKWLVS